LSFAWDQFDLPQQPLHFTSKAFRTQIVTFIDEALVKCRSVMIVSKTNQNRSILVAALYLMTKYKWTVSKTLEYLSCRKPDMLLTNDHITALKNVEKQIISFQYGVEALGLKVDKP